MGTHDIGVLAPATHRTDHEPAGDIDHVNPDRALADALSRGTEFLRREMTIDRFRSRSDAFLFAGRQWDLQDLVYLEQGSADDVRDMARTELRCPEPGCASPAVTTVKRAHLGFRDGFRHQVKAKNGAHAPESVLHRQGKALVARWAATLPQVASAELEVRVGNERIADVLITLVTGERVAVEIQYYGIEASEWFERTESYERAGVPVVWLFGSAGSMSPLTNKLRWIHKLVLRQGQPLLWINPVEEAAGWLEIPGRLVGEHDGPEAEMVFGTLSNLELTAEGVFPPGYRATRERAREEEHAQAQRIAAEQQAWRIRMDEYELNAAARRNRPARSRSSFRPMPEPTKPKLRCKRCGLPLDPCLADSGVHVDRYCDKW